MWRIARQLLVYLTALPVVLACSSVNAQGQATTQLNICHAGSLTAAFTQVETQFTSQNPGVTIKDVSAGSLDLARQIASGVTKCDVYAPADFADIDLFFKPAGLASYNIVFAQGRMVLAYIATDPNTTGIAAAGTFSPPATVPDAVPNWYQIVMAPGVTVGGSHPFLDPSGYRSHMIFQLAQTFYKLPDLYNALLEHYLAIPSTVTSATTNALTQFALGKQYDFSLTYEHSAVTAAASNPEYRYVLLPDSIDLSNPANNSTYAQATVVVPGLGTTGTAPSVTIPGSRVEWGVTIVTNAANEANAVTFLQLLLGPTGTSALTTNGPTPITPAVVSASDFAKLPASLQPLVKQGSVSP